MDLCSCTNTNKKCGGSTNCLILEKPPERYLFDTNEQKELKLLEDWVKDNPNTELTKEDKIIRQQIINRKITTTNYEDINYSNIFES